VRRRALVTGGAGFIGSHVADVLITRDFAVLVVDDLSSGDEANVPRLAELERLDIADDAHLTRVVSAFAPDVVCHLAAQSSVTVSVRRPDLDFASNVRGTFNVCQAAKELRAPVVFASTGGALYGDRAPVPTSETFPPEPLAPYGASKLAGEAYVATWGRFHGIPNTILRLGNVYGQRQSPHGEAGVVAIFSDRLLGGTQPTVYGDGTQTRDYVHVADVADAFSVAAERPVGGAFNVGRGTEVSVLEILAELQDAAGTSLEPRFEPLRAGELTRSALDPAAIAAKLGWRARIGLRDGLRDTFRSYAGRPAAADGALP
jgi:UDP-glucose 4-epimerase